MSGECEDRSQMKQKKTILSILFLAVLMFATYTVRPSAARS